MKKVYWRPQAVSKTALLLIALLAISGHLLVDNVRSIQKQSHYDLKQHAAENMRKGMEMIREERFRLGVPIDTEKDPTESGMVGLPMSAVTSISGALEAKQTSVNPNFAAIVVDMLTKADIKKGDTVAVGVSGSFPALNLAVYCALEALEVKPIIIASAAASQWGANIPDLMWLDMERLLSEQGLISSRAIAASIGGYEDSGLGLTDEGRVLVSESIERNMAKLLPTDQGFTEKIDTRMELYKTQAGGAPIKCYINVGGGTISVGRSLGKKMFKPGLNRRPPSQLKRIDGLMARFIKQKVPVIHMVQVTELADRYGLAQSPITMPAIGEASVFQTSGVNRWLAAGVLVTVLASLFGFIRSDVGFRLFQTRKPTSDSAPPEPMV